MRDGCFVGKVVFVIGGVGGIGVVIVWCIVVEGVSVVIGDINIGFGEMLVVEVSGIFIMFDVIVEVQWCMVIEWIEVMYGWFDGLVNNVGINCSIGGEILVDVVIDDLCMMMVVNVEGMVLGCKYGMVLIVRSGGGVIVNMVLIVGDLLCDFIVVYGVIKVVVVYWICLVVLYCVWMGMQV